MVVSPSSDNEAMKRQLRYVLITPAHNEADYIEKTIESVVSQTVLPRLWIVVSDGSTDETADIVRRYLPSHPWIELIERPPRQERHFAAKVEAFDAGYDRVRELEYDVIGNIDGDVSFGADYIEFLLSQFAANPELGVAGTDYTEGEFHSFRDSYINPQHVNGQCQIFEKGMFRGDRRLRAESRWRRRLDRRYHGTYEGMGDTLFSRTHVLSSPADGYGRYQRDGC